MSQSEYGQQLIKAVSSSAFYVKEADDAGQSGTVVLCIRASISDLGPALIERSSGFPILDGTALYAAGIVLAQSAYNPSRGRGPKVAPGAVALPRPPDSLLNGQAHVWLRLPISFGPGDPSIPPRAPQIVTRYGLFDRATCLFMPPGDEANTPAPTTAKEIDSSPATKFDWDAYGHQMTKAISENIFYPAPAAALGIEGMVNVRLALQPDNSLVCAKVDRPSGNALLDGVALISIGLLYVIGKAPSPPGGFPQGLDLIEFALPVNFEFR